MAVFEMAGCGRSCAWFASWRGLPAWRRPSFAAFMLMVALAFAMGNFHPTVAGQVSAAEAAPVEETPAKEGADGNAAASSPLRLSNT